MAADLVPIQQVHDIDRYRNEYLPGLRLFLRKHGAEVLVAGFNAEPVEGEPPNSTVVPWWHVDSLAAFLSSTHGTHNELSAWFRLPRQSGRQPLNWAGRRGYQGTFAMSAASRPAVGSTCSRPA